MRCGVARNDNGSYKEKKSYWILKITIITFLVAMLFSFAADFTTNHSSMTIAVFLLCFLIIISIIFDGIAVAITACDKAPLASMAARKMKSSKIAVKLKSNADKVANICADVIGDICGIVSGACVIVIVYRILAVYPTLNAIIITILFSSTVAAVTVGGKAIMKSISYNNSKEIVMIVAKVLNIFYKEKNL